MSGTVARCLSASREYAPNKQGMWFVVQQAARRQLEQVTIFQDNMQPVWGSLNLRSKQGPPHWRVCGLEVSGSPDNMQY